MVGSKSQDLAAHGVGLSPPSSFTRWTARSRGRHHENDDERSLYRLPARLASFLRNVYLVTWSERH